MIVKYCEYCRKVQPYNHKCKLKPKQTTAINHNDFYYSSAWVKKRQAIKARFYGIDVYDFVVNDVITYGTTVHHIVPLADNERLKLTDSNLILLSDGNHKLIHRMLDQNYISTIRLMRDVLQQWQMFCGVGGG